MVLGADLWLYCNDVLAHLCLIQNAAQLKPYIDGILVSFLFFFLSCAFWVEI